MEREFSDQFLRKLDTSSTVSVGVEWWRPATDTHDSWDDDKKGPANAGFGWETDAEREVATVIVHTTREHQTQNVLDHVGFEDSFSGGWADTSVCEGTSDDGT